MPGRKPEVSDDELLRAFLLAADPVLTASEVAARVDMTRQGAHRRLQQLERDGLIRSKKVGAKAVVWWLSDEGRDRAARR